MKRSPSNLIVRNPSFLGADNPSTLRAVRTGRLGVVLLAAVVIVGESRLVETRPKEARVPSECRTAVTLSFRQTPLEEVLRSLQDLTGMEVLIDEETRKTSITAEAENASVIKALDSILESTGLNYALVVDPRDPCRVQKLYVGKPGDFDARTARPLMRDEEDATVVPRSAREEGPQGPVDVATPSGADPDPASPSESPSRGNTSSSYPAPAGAPNVAGTDASSSAGQVANDIPAPDTASGTDAEAAEPPPVADETGEVPDSEPPEVDLSTPPPPDPMNLYRYFSGDSRTRLYHRLSCRDAMFTPPAAKTWFASEEQARAYEYVPHSCLQQSLPR